MMGNAANVHSHTVTIRGDSRSESELNESVVVCLGQRLLRAVVQHCRLAEMTWTHARRERCRISGNRWLRGQRRPEANRWKRRERRLYQPTSPCPPIGQAAYSCRRVRRSGHARELNIETALLSWSWISWGRRQRPLLSIYNQGDVCESVIALSNLAQHSMPVGVLFIIFSNYFDWNARARRTAPEIGSSKRRLRRRRIEGEVHQSDAQPQELRMSETATTRRLVVGYIATDRGRDAISLAISIARSIDVELVVTIVRPESATILAGSAVPKDGAGIVAQQIDDWLDEALALIPDDVKARGAIHIASNESKGLMEVAEKEGALGIVIGARATTLMRQLRIGTVASSLLHASTVPVVLAPSGKSDIGPISRVTALYGARPGASSLIGAAIESAFGLGVDLRLLSLIEDDGLYDDEVAEITEFAEQYGGAVLADQASEMLASGRATVKSKAGADIEEAAEAIEWQPGDLAFIGSSRLGRGGKVAIGARARRLLRVLPVPVVVVPRRAVSSVYTTEAG